MALPQPPSGTGPSILMSHLSRAQLQASTQVCCSFSVSLFGHRDLSFFSRPPGLEDNTVNLRKQNKAATWGLDGWVNLSGSIFLINTILDPLPKLEVLCLLLYRGRGSSLPFQTLNLECGPSEPFVCPELCHISPGKARVHQTTAIHPDLDKAENGGPDPLLMGVVLSSTSEAVLSWGC